MISKSILKVYYAVVQPLVLLLSKLGVSPFFLTIGGIGMNVWAAFFFYYGSFRSGAFFLLAAGIFDSIDGRLARDTGKTSAYGAFMDSIADRLGEIVVFTGLLLRFSAERPAFSLIIMTALSGSLMVSYTRARAEGLGIDCKVGMFQRPERFMVMFIGALLGQWGIILAVWIIAVMTCATTAQRILYIRDELRK